jgi:hypothetical protein
MPLVVNSSAVILCAHGGKVTLIPKQMTVTAGGSPVMCEGDIMGSPIVGCAQPPSVATKPCTLVVSTLPGGSSLKVSAGGKPVHIDTLTGMTDGVPPGVITVVSAGQTSVQG